MYGLRFHTGGGGGGGGGVHACDRFDNKESAPVL